MSDTDKTKEAEALLQNILEEVAARGAEMVEFERVPAGLEITCFAGHTGIGKLLDARALETALFEVVEEKAGEKNSFEMKLRGQSRRLKISWYDSFGETCFRLKFMKPK